MNKVLATIVFFMFFTARSEAQSLKDYELGVGLRFQKTEQLYLENGLAADFTSDFLFHRKVHLKMSYATSRLGSAIGSNAIKQDNYLVGADWRFRSDKDFQVFAGLNTGFFHADMEIPKFNVLPHNSMLFSLETGFFYKFRFPMATSLSVGYNFINGNGVSTPGTLFPVFYQLSVYYYIHKK
ncbi:MAG TPA: hypothetical protein VK152_09045 [Paludibacter sp.]|nr:hypothetical protein [Paludibacter sp.]